MMSELHTSVFINMPPISEVGGSNSKPYVGKVVVSYRWSAVYSTGGGTAIRP